MNLCLLCLGLHSQPSLHLASWEIITIKQKPYAIAAPQIKRLGMPRKETPPLHAIKLLGNSHMRVEMHAHFLNIGLAMQMETPFLNLGLRTPQGDG